MPTTEKPIPLATLLREATPRPWTTSPAPLSGGRHILGADQETAVAHVHDSDVIGVTTANAALIERAVNTIESLVHLLQWIHDDDLLPMAYANARHQEIRDVLRAALRRVQGDA